MPDTAVAAHRRGVGPREIGSHGLVITVMGLLLHRSGGLSISTEEVLDPLLKSIKGVYGNTFFTL